MSSPTPMTLSTAQHVSGVDPLTGDPTPAVRGDRARDDQRAVLQGFLPQYRDRARELMRQLGHRDAPRGKPGGRKRRR